MVKSFISGFFLAIVFCGIAYFFFGRTDYKELRNLADGIQRSNKEAQRSIGEITIRLDGLNGTSSRITERSYNITEGSQQANLGVSKIKEGLGEANDSITRIERRNIEVIRLVRDLGDTNYKFRKLIKSYTEKK